MAKKLLLYDDFAFRQSAFYSLVLLFLLIGSSNTSAAAHHTVRVQPVLKGVVDGRPKKIDLPTEMAAALAIIQKAREAGIAVTTYHVMYDQALASVKADEPPEQTRMILDSITSAFGEYTDYRKLMLELTGKEAISGRSVTDLEEDNSKDQWHQYGTDFSPFMRDLAIRIKRVWHPPQLSQTVTAVFTFQILADGSLGRVKILKHSGSDDFDLASYMALQKVAPFPSLPKATRFPLEIEFNFNYNVLKNAPAVSK